MTPLESSARSKNTSSALMNALDKCQSLGRILRHELLLKLFKPCVEVAAELAHLRIVDVFGRPLLRRQLLAKKNRLRLGLV